MKPVISSISGLFLLVTILASVDARRMFQHARRFGIYGGGPGLGGMGGGGDSKDGGGKDGGGKDGGGKDGGAKGCTCVRIYDPVCGKNGVTYGNQCLHNCANKDAEIAYPAVCIPIVVVPKT